MSGEIRIARIAPNIVSIDETFNVGMDIGTPVSDDYQTPLHSLMRSNRSRSNSNSRRRETADSPRYGFYFSERFETFARLD
jgi:hypothetical protein